MDETVVDGITYVRLYHSPDNFLGDPSAFMAQFSEDKRAEMRRKAIAHMVEIGFYMRKDDWEKERSIYGDDELFAGM